MPLRFMLLPGDEHPDNIRERPLAASPHGGVSQITNRPPRFASHEA